MKPLWFLLGPTACGKSQLAMELAAHDAAIELISIDSAQVYRDMNIGTAKPTLAEQAHVRHHLLDTITPAQSWSVAQYCAAFNAALRDITDRGKTPLVVGGTMMYVSALIAGLSDIPPAQVEVRATIEAQAAEEGWPALHAELMRVDAATARRLPPTDAQRISRALEVFRGTGTPLSSLQGARKPLLTSHTPRLLVLTPSDRTILHTRIAQRFEAMLQTGLIDEVHRLRETYALDGNMPSMRCVGYRQAWQYVEGEIDLASLREQGVAATRQLAKRQLTWQRHQFAAFSPHVVDSLHASALAQIKALMASGAGQQ
jgi:tRNA dimethylallyltransferase